MKADVVVIGRARRVAAPSRRRRTRGRSDGTDGRSIWAAYCGSVSTTGFGLHVFGGN